MQTTVFKQDNKEVIQEGNHFFIRVTEGNETFESGDFNTLESAVKEVKRQNLNDKVSNLFKAYSDYTSLSEGHYEYLLDEESFKDAIKDLIEWYNKNAVKS